MPYPTAPQIWAITGAVTATSDLRHADGFWNHCDNENIDAPLCLPGGSTVATEYEGKRKVIGNLIVREGAFQ